MISRSSQTAQLPLEAMLIENVETLLCFPWKQGYSHTITLLYSMGVAGGDKSVATDCIRIKMHQIKIEEWS